MRNHDLRHECARKEHRRQSKGVESGWRRWKRGKDPQRI